MIKKVLMIQRELKPRDDIMPLPGTMGSENKKRLEEIKHHVVSLGAVQCGFNFLLVPWCVSDFSALCTRKIS